VTCCAARDTPYDEIGLDNPDLTEGQLLDAMMAHPILINRPIVVTRRSAFASEAVETVWTSCRTRSAARLPRRTGERLSTAQVTASHKELLHECIREIEAAAARRRKARWAPSSAI